MAGVHDASRTAAAIPPSQRKPEDTARINMGDQATRNADFAARQHEKIYGAKKS